MGGNVASSPTDLQDYYEELQLQWYWQLPIYATSSYASYVQHKISGTLSSSLHT